MVLDCCMSVLLLYYKCNIFILHIQYSKQKK
nr:MAG TPA: hypothetical protein [Caudoviricetes sp.]